MSGAMIGRVVVEGRNTIIVFPAGLPDLGDDVEVFKQGDDLMQVPVRPSPLRDHGHSTTAHGENKR